MIVKNAVVRVYVNIIEENTGVLSAHQIQIIFVKLADYFGVIKNTKDTVFDVLFIPSLINLYPEIIKQKKKL
jgi:hypothetical protein